MKKILFLFLITSFLSSCMVMHSGNMVESSGPNQNNFTYINNAVGSSSATYILGFGGFGHKGLVREAKNDLIKNYPVKNGEALINFTVDVSTKYFLNLVIIKSVVVSADIIKYQ